MISRSRRIFLFDVVWQRIRHNRMALTGAGIVLVMFLMAAAASFSSADPAAIDIGQSLL
ncbi:MAG: peptide ABC transporter permease, partial [Desulfuromusa sp.]|nr:peptide ABC transporter permease [Desulfuromusa sp.]